MTETLLTTREVAKALRISEARLQDLLRRGKIAEPDKIGGRRVWKASDIATARVVLLRN